MTAGPIRVRDAGDADLASIARLHVEAFDDSVLSELGVEAVRRNYRWQLTGPHDLTALVSTDGSEVLGFLFGGVFRGSTIGFVKREKWFLLRSVLARPGILLRGVGWSRITLAVRLLLRRSPTSQPEDPAAVPRRSFGVLAIAVDPAAQGRGVGASLMVEARRRAAAQGFRSMHLSVHPGNAKALAFYRSLGWTELVEADGRWAGRMTTSLEEAS